MKKLILLLMTLTGIVCGMQEAEQPAQTRMRTILGVAYSCAVRAYPFAFGDAIRPTTHSTIGEQLQSLNRQIKRHDLDPDKVFLILCVRDTYFEKAYGLSRKMDHLQRFHHRVTIGDSVLPAYLNTGIIIRPLNHEKLKLKAKL